MIKRIGVAILVVAFSPFYISAYGISKLFRIPGVEDMETIPEWFGMIQEYKERCYE